jgi:hypothetical protein
MRHVLPSFVRISSLGVLQVLVDAPAELSLQEVQQQLVTEMHIPFRWSRAVPVDSLGERELGVDCITLDIMPAAAATATAPVPVDSTEAAEAWARVQQPEPKGDQYGNTNARTLREVADVQRGRHGEATTNTNDDGLGAKRACNFITRFSRSHRRLCVEVMMPAVDTPAALTTHHKVSRLSIVFRTADDEQQRQQQQQQQQQQQTAATPPQLYADGLPFVGQGGAATQLRYFTTCHVCVATTQKLCKWAGWCGGDGRCHASAAAMQQQEHRCCDSASLFWLILVACWLLGSGTTTRRTPGGRYGRCRKYNSSSLANAAVCDRPPPQLPWRIA